MKAAGHSLAVVVFSRDRACQLDACLRSLSTYAPDVTVSVVLRATSEPFRLGYARCATDHPAVTFVPETDFGRQVVELLERQHAPLACFLTDDDLVTQPVRMDVIESALRDAHVLAFSLRLGRNTTYCYSMARPQAPPAFQPCDHGHLTWSWPGAEGDFGYPMSVDGQIFRASELREILRGLRFASPNSLEGTMADMAGQFTESKPMLACFSSSALVGVPLNRVQNECQNRSGQDPQMTAEALNRAYLSGARLQYMPIDVIGAHQEVPATLVHVKEPSMPTFHSQAGQDRFVYAIAVLGERRSTGTFLDVGCSHPVVWSNTCALERVGWTGVLIDKDPNVGALIAADRRSPFVFADATTIDWLELCDAHGLRRTIDYLSFDLDASGGEAFAAMPWASLRFRILTVEHDAYRFGDGVRQRMRSILRGHGYDLLCPDVKNEGLEFEDWWVDPSAVDMSVANRLRTHKATDWREIVERSGH